MTAPHDQKALGPSATPLGSPGAMPRHGGDIAAAETRFGKPAAGWLDLSTGVNPFAYPLPQLASDVWKRLPDETAHRRLQLAAAEAWGVADPERILAAPGTQALIQLLPLLRPPGRVAILGPTYPGHADAFARAGHEVVACATLNQLGQAEIGIVVNPNNPDGRRSDPAALRDLADEFEARGGLLIVDESFVDLAPELSIAAHAGPGLLVLRSFGKFFGLAGLRLGFAVAAPELVRLLREGLGPWAVSGPALEVGRIALADQAWIEVTRARLAKEATQLDRLLNQAGLAIQGGMHLFRLAGAPRAWALFEHLGRRGILVRPFDEHPRWLRFGLPPDPAARDRLATALAAWRD